MSISKTIKILHVFTGRSEQERNEKTIFISIIKLTKVEKKELIIVTKTFEIFLFFFLVDTRTFASCYLEA